VIYLYNEKNGDAEGDGETESAPETQDAPTVEFTDVEYSETEAKEPDDDGEK
jgi:hypothetical protein